MKRSKILKTLSVALAVLMTIMSCGSAAFAAAGDFTERDGIYLISNTLKKIAPGITENCIITNKASGQSQVTGYAVTVDLSGTSSASISAGYADYDGSKWQMQTVRNQALAFEKKTGENVVAAFNADIFNMSTGEPTGGPLVLNGQICKAGLGQCYFGITKDGKPVVGDNLTQSILDNLKEAVGGFYLLARSGQRIGMGWNTDYLAPRVAVGIKADGSVVLYSADGRNFPKSCGLNNYDCATIMLGLGCIDVLSLDGGGSATYLAKYEGSNELVLANRPSDAGVERKVSSTLFVTSSAKPSGVFDHASLTPNNELYTPGTEVGFSALGVDSSGASAPLPADGSFSLDSSSAALGEISADGTFKSNGKTGVVTVNYVTDGVVAGSTSVEIVDPDSIYFADEEISLGFGDKTDLGLNVRYKGRDVNFKAGDFVWSTSYEALSNEQKFEYNGKGVIYLKNENALYYYTKGANTYVLGARLTDAESADFYNTILGKFDGNTFISADGNSVTGTVTAKYVNNDSVTASIKAIVGKLPVVVQDFEKKNITFGRVAFNANGGVLKWESAEGDYDMLTGHYLNGDGTSRDGKESAEIVDVDSGEPVRFGNQSLKLNYDFTNINGIEGACVGFTEKGTEIEGNPTGIGMWVYVPEGTPNFWLRIRLLDGNNNILTLDFTPQKQGINWFGWKYVECDLTQKQGPFKLLAGETIRLMHTYSAYDGMGDWLAGTVTTAGPDENSVKLDRANCKGSVYIDNLQFVYGANVDDIDNPVVDSIKINNTELSDGAVVNTDKLSFEAYFSDVQNKYTSGIDYDVVRLYIDGKNMTDKSTLTKGDDRINLYDLRLADGEHTVKVLVRDKFGNETTETRSFTVDTNGTSELTGIEITPSSDVLLGRSFALSVGSNKVSDIKSFSTVIKLNDLFTDFTVEFDDAFDGTYSYNEKTNELTLGATLKQDGNAKGDIARVVFNVPSSLPSGSVFAYSADGVFETFSDIAGAANSLAFSTKRYAVVAPLTISANPIVGLPATIKVSDNTGEPEANAFVYSGSTLLGTTDENGEFVTDAFSDKVQSISLSAKSESGISFTLNTQSVAPAGNADGTPSSVSLNASSDSTSSKNITWLSNPVASLKDSVVKYALKADYDANGEAAFDTVTGTAENRFLMGSAAIANNYAIKVNTVVLNGLKPDSEYVYKVGDGEHFSSVSSFKTTFKGANTNFFIIGDTQAEDTTNISNIIKSLGNSGVNYSFGVQTGDFVEKPTMYSDWNSILDVFGKDYMRTVDLIHVIGNHEQFGDDINDLFAAALYNSPATHYSAEYGNVYVAVINYTGNASALKSELEWLKSDSAKSNAQWKILVSHQPAYGTNAAATDTKHFNELVPPVLEEAGFDFMFSGHDHAFARTMPLKGGLVSDDGVVYYVCGSTGEKSYSATNNPAYHFDVVDQEYNAIYLTVEADDERIVVKTHESDGSVIDTYSKAADTACADDGHSYVFGDGYLVCSACGHAEKLGVYTGFAKDKATGRTRYFLNGETQYGWLNYVDDCYYLDENGLAVTGNRTVDGIPYRFDGDGKQIGGAFHKDADGITRCYRGGNYLTGWHELEGNLYFFTNADAVAGKMYTGKATIRLYTGQEITYKFASDGRLLEGSFYEYPEGTVYYWGPNLLTGWQEIKGKTYYFDLKTGYMCTDTLELDGEYYSFNSDGTFAHNGAHEWVLSATKDATCTKGASEIYKCGTCGGTKTVYTSEPLGHVDENGDYICDVCGRYAENGKGFIKWFMELISKIRAFFEKIINLFKGIGG